MMVHERRQIQRNIILCNSIYLKPWKQEPQPTERDIRSVRIWNPLQGDENVLYLDKAVAASFVHQLFLKVALSNPHSAEWDLGCGLGGITYTWPFAQHKMLNDGCDFWFPTRVMVSIHFPFTDSPFWYTHLPVISLLTVIFSTSNLLWICISINTILDLSIDSGNRPLSKALNGPSDCKEETLTHVFYLPEISLASLLWNCG